MFSENLYAFGEASFVLRQNFKLTRKLYTKGITFFVIKIYSVFNTWFKHHTLLYNADL